MLSSAGMVGNENIQPNQLKDDRVNMFGENYAATRLDSQMQEDDQG